MEYFSEIYGIYYSAVAAVLSRAFSSPLSEKEITEIVNENAFGESALYILPKLLSGEWPLLRKDENNLYFPVIKNPVRLPLTNLQKAWLVSILCDNRCSAFFNKAEIENIKSALDSEPLYDFKKIKTVDACADSDNFSENNYSENFRTIINAIRNKSILRISYTGGSGSRVSADYLPCRLEYSPKDDKFRLHCIKIRKGKASVFATVNLGRIIKLEVLCEHSEFDADIDFFIQKGKESEPAVIELTDRRNALERFMVQFASYDKHTRHNEETDKYICSVFYNKADEVELLIRLLSFGPVIKILSPESLVSQARERIHRQTELMGK